MMDLYIDQTAGFLDDIIGLHENARVSNHIRKGASKYVSVDETVVQMFDYYSIPFQYRDISEVVWNILQDGDIPTTNGIVQVLR